MKLYPNQLATHLQQGLAEVYFVSGDEPLLVQECADAIRHSALQQGYDERIRLSVDAQFDWQQLQDASQNLSLFSEKRLIELHMPSAKPGDKGGKALLAYLDDIPDDTVLLIITGKIEAASKRSKWYKALEKQAASLQIWPVDRKQLPQWLEQRARQRGLQFTPEALQALADRVEGNLLAAAQNIEKLYIQYGDTLITEALLLASISDSSRYDVFKLLDSAMQGDAERTIKILAGLQGEGAQPVMILWALARQCRILAKIASGLAQGLAFNELCRKQGIWDKQMPQVQRALQNRNAVFFQRLLIRAKHIDETIKGVQMGDPWNALRQLSLTLATS